MARIERPALFGKLNEIGYRSIESATNFCKLRGNPEVEIVHWVRQLLQLPDGDFLRILENYEIDASRFSADVTAALDRLERGSRTIRDFSDSLLFAVERGWIYATLLFKETQVRTGHLLVGLLETRRLRRELFDISKELEKINVEDLTDRFGEIVRGSPEEGLSAEDGFQIGGGALPGEASGSMAPPQMGKKEALRRFAVDLTENARKGLIDPIVGRDEEIRQVVGILMRRRQNNPILTGEAGVGKTAVVEGLARRIAKADVPPPLRQVELRSLDIGLLQAGASMKGEFENRLKQVIEEVQSSPRPIILFIDEAHTLIGAGGSAGTGDAANLLKPALARGTLRSIAATTWAEYRAHIEGDAALTRRFQVVRIEEPSPQGAVRMLRSLASRLEEHHDVQVLDEAIEAAVKLSSRYISGRWLPDKAVGLLDTACARVATGLHAEPAEVEDARRNIESLEIELEILEREKNIGLDRRAREAVARKELAGERERLRALEERWSREREKVDRILALRRELGGRGGRVEGAGAGLPAEADPAAVVSPESEDKAAEAAKEGEGRPLAAGAARRLSDEAEREERLGRLGSLQEELTAIQGDQPLILADVDANAVASVVADWTGIPVGRMVRNEIEGVLGLADRLAERVIGQRHALEAIARRVHTSRAGLEHPGKPIGVFLLCGPSGVGKTETALALAEALYGQEDAVITINMSEYQDQSSVSNLKGSAKGLVGYQEGGILTEAVRHKPYSVVLLDEFEKAHADVHEVFYQVFDKGVLQDSRGTRVDFKNTLILLTSNCGTKRIVDLCRDPELVPLPDRLTEAVREVLLETFPAALLGRLVSIPYYPLSAEMLDAITRLQLGRIQRRVEESHAVAFEYDDEVVELITSRCDAQESGGRMIDSILTQTLLPSISREILTRMLEGKPLEKIHIGVEEGDFSYGFA